MTAQGTQLGVGGREDAGCTAESRNHARWTPVYGDEVFPQHTWTELGSCYNSFAERNNKPRPPYLQSDLPLFCLKIERIPFLSCVYQVFFMFDDLDIGHRKDFFLK